MRATRGDLRVLVEEHIAFAHAREDGLEGEIVLLRDRVEFVRMAPGAVGRGADERSHRLRHDVIAFHVLERLRRRRGRAEVIGPRAEVAEGGGQGRLVGKKMVGSKLLANQPRPGGVRIEGLDDVVAIAPRERPKDVMLGAMRIGEVDRIEPVPRPAFAVARRGEHSVNELAPILVCRRR